MTFSQYAGTAIVPTLARLVLAAAFISAGWNKVFKHAEFTAAEAMQLRTLGVTADPAPPKIVDASSTLQDEGVRGSGQSHIVLASLRQDPDPAASAPEVSAPPATPDPGPTPAAGSTAPPPATQPLLSGTYTAQGLHKITLMLHANNFPYAAWQARLAAFTELVGGAMLLLGLFSRIWGLGLSVAMGVAFYLVSMKTNGIFTMDPRDFAENIGAFNTAYCQLGLFVLAFGVMLTGAGPLSLDRMLFGGGDANPGNGKID